MQGIEAYDQQPDQMDVLLDQFLEQRDDVLDEKPKSMVVRCISDCFTCLL